MIHYHGTPISPREALTSALPGRHFCVSYAEPRDVAICHEIGQSVMLDNGAFSLWKAGKPTDWPGYYRWAERWLEYPTTWAVVPDVIDGSEEENDLLLEDWPFADRGAPVWHMHEGVDRLLRLCEEWSRVCLGSSGAYAAVGSRAWHRRMVEAMDTLCVDSVVPCWLHGLRMMSMSGTHYPLASADSTDIARNHRARGNSAEAMAARWDARQNPSRWQRHEQLELVA